MFSCATRSARRSAAMAARSPRCAPTISPPIPLKALMARNPNVDWATARRGRVSAAPTRPARTTATSRAWRLLLAGLPDNVPGVTVNRLCASGLNAVGDAARAIRAGEIDFVDRRRRRVDDPRAVRAWARRGGLRALGGDLRHHHRLALHQSADEASSTASMRCRRPARTSPRNIQVSRADQDAFACARSSAPARRSRRATSPRRSCRSRCRAARPARQGRQGRASAPGDDARRARQAQDPFARNPGTVTAGNASGVNDGAAAMILASAKPP